jgi:hypothetical protein
MIAYYKLLINPLDAKNVVFVKAMKDKFVKISSDFLSLHHGTVAQPKGCGGLKIHEVGEEPLFYDYEDSNEADYIRAKEAYWDAQGY